LAEGQVYAGDSNFYKRSLNAYAAVTPAQVRMSMTRWLSAPPLRIRLIPGDRPVYQDASGPAKRIAQGVVPPSTKRIVPPIGTLSALKFPAVERSTLSNGVRVTYARRTAVPVTQMALVFDAGVAADQPDARGLQSFALNLLDEGAAGMSSQAIAEREEELGADIGASSTNDVSQVTLSALSANLAPSLDLLQSIVERPDFQPADVERVRTQVLTGIAQQQKDPNGIAARALPALLYGPSHPYGAPGSGDPQAVRGFTRADLVGFQQRWLRPDNVQIFVVSDQPLASLVPQIEARFGQWATPGVAKGAKAFGALPARPTGQRIVLIDRPGSPQSVILGAEVTPVDPRGDVVAVQGASEVLGGNFLSRMNTDLRETKGWSYGVSGNVQLTQNAVPYVIRAPVQADRTGESIAALNSNITDILGAKGVTDEERTRLVSNNVDVLTGRFETGGAVLAALIQNSLYGRPDNYYEALAGRYRALTQVGLNSALKGAVDPRSLVWIVVGDAAKVRPQLDKLGLPVEVMTAR
jgi:zinc protease